MRYKRFGLYATAFALVVGIFGGVPLAPTAFAAARTCTWTGIAGDNKFSTAGNWSDCNNDVPQAGDIVTIDETDVTDNQVLTNDLTVALGGVTLSSALTAWNGAGKNIKLTALKLADNALVSSTGNYNGLYVTVGTPDKVDVIAEGALIISTNHLYYKNLKAAGVLTVGGTTSYYYRAGDTFTRLVVGAIANVSFDATQATHTLAFPIDFQGPRTQAVVFYSYCATFGQYSCAKYGDATWTLSGAISTANTLSVEAGENTTVNFTGAIDRSKITKGASNQGIIQFAGETFTLPKTTVNFEGDTTTSEQIVENQTATLLGKRSGVFVGIGGTIKGTGTMQYLSVMKGAVVAPGLSPGCLTSSSSFYLSGEYQFELGGKTACSEYDQIKITNATSTYPIVNLDDTATLVTSRYNNYNPAQGDVFTIIDQAGTQAIDGTFQNLPEGATFEQNGIVFKISYVGGDGNDVTLTVMNKPVAPDTGFKLLTAQPLLTFAVAAAAALGLFGLARKLQTKR